jgi:aminomethyltransferase
MEMKYCLYGNDIDQTTNPIEAGLGWITDLSKNNFIGKSVLLSTKENNPDRRLVTFALNERGIPRHDYRIQADGVDVGFVTSGTQSMSLSKGIGMAYINKGFAKVGNAIDVMIRSKSVSATIVKPPFVKETSILD